MNILNMLKNLIKRGKQTSAADDSGSLSLKAPCSFLGQNRNVKQISPYGLYGSPVNGSNWIIFSSLANSDDLVGIGNDYKNRPKNLKEGEVVLQNLKTGAFIKFDASGNIEIITDKDIVATAANVTITATTAVVTAITATITATDINLNGAVKITGSLDVNGVIFNTHRHVPSVVPPTNP